MAATDVTKGSARPFWRIIGDALGRIMLFLFVAMPMVFLLLMTMGGYAISYFEGWQFQRGYNFMASAITGGAIIFPAEPPTKFSGKLCAVVAGATGVGIFGFMIATLANSLVDPIISLFGLDAKDRSLSGVFGKLGGLASIVMIANLLFAVFFGWVFSLLDPDVGLFPAVKAMASIQLGGGVSFHGQGAPTTTSGDVFYTIVGVWAIGVSATVIAISAGPGAEVVEEQTGLRLKTGATIRMAVEKLALLVLLFLPSVLFLLMVCVASVMDSLTSWQWKGAFWAALPATTGGAAALSSEGNPPLGLLGVVLLICVASAGLFVMCVFIGVGATLMGPITDRLTFLHTPEGYSETSAVRASVVALFVVCSVLIPAAAFTLAVPVGGLLAYIEGWHFLDGLWWCVAVQLGGGMALTSSQIKTHVGMVVGTIAVAWSIGISIITVGLAGAPIVEPLMEALGMKVDKEELREVLNATKGIATYGASVTAIDKESQ